MSADLKRKLELTSAAMKEVVAEQVPSELKKLKKEKKDLEEENARLRQENAQLTEYRQLYTEERIPEAVNILRHTQMRIRALNRTVQQLTPELALGVTPYLAETHNFIDHAERVLEGQMSSEGEEL